MAAPNSRSTLIDYCLRSLGSPVIEINVDDDQVGDRIDEALQLYQTYHADAIEKIFLKHKITGSSLLLTTAVAANFSAGEVITGSTSGATAFIHTNAASTIVYKDLTHLDDIAFISGETITGTTSTTTAVISSITIGDIQNKYLPLNSLITDVVQIMPISDSNTNSMFDAQYQMRLNDVHSLGFLGSLVDYAMSQQWLALLNNIIDNGTKHISFDRHKNQLRVDMNWEAEVLVGQFVVVECYRVIDPASYAEVYNDYFLKKYATALIKQQWGQNLLKFEGMQMPGGVTFNGRQLFEDAKEELIKLEEELRLNWEQPVDFYIG